ncbi:MAG: hypothetical protein HOI95_09750 [Chromatiales bacterium]|jgi:hypothetical protein|nr:hypothetical protein [Chromatiales bacterium]
MDRDAYTTANLVGWEEAESHHRRHNMARQLAEMGWYSALGAPPDLE